MRKRVRIIDFSSALLLMAVIRLFRVSVRLVFFFGSVGDLIGRERFAKIFPRVGLALTEIDDDHPHLNWTS